MNTYTIFVPLASDPRFGTYYTTMAGTPKKALANVFFRLYGREIKHNYSGWKWKVEKSRQ